MGRGVLGYSVRKPGEEGITGADPVADAGKPLGVGRGHGVDEEAGLLAAVTEAAEGIVAVPASAALPVAFLPLRHRARRPSFPKTAPPRGRRR
ncbi:hypothetical protein B296_00040500 [Ensete ventricosum]|uniref:Uncharacterized protein n=1 Tax=Ensete ventricosum TaxID=4639 RepID=A0A426ZJT1_ENSVE|nr:hypothetical protein B296_00040500 [Ensete ventricosum]